MLNIRQGWVAKPGYFLLLVQVLVLGWLGFLVMNQLFRGHTLHDKIVSQSRENSSLDHRNQRLVSHVDALRSGDLSVIEERARKDLGMVKDEETFFIFVD